MFPLFGRLIVDGWRELFTVKGMRKFMTILLGVVALPLFSAPIDENDWIFKYPSFGVSYDSGSARFTGNEDTQARLYFDESKISRLSDGFSASLELPPAITLGGSSVEVGFRSTRAGAADEWITWSASFSVDSLSVSIFASDGTSLEKDLPIIFPPEERFEFFISFEKGADGLFSAVLSTLGESFVLGNLDFSEIVGGSFHIGIIGQNFEMDKDNPMLRDFSCVAGIPEPSNIAALAALCALAAVFVRRRK